MSASIALIEEYSFSQESSSLGVSGLAESARLMESLGFDEILSSENSLSVVTFNNIAIFDP